MNMHPKPDIMCSELSAILYKLSHRTYNPDPVQSDVTTISNKCFMVL